jgi:hypothetical protein
LNVFFGFVEHVQALSFYHTSATPDLHRHVASMSVQKEGITFAWRQRLRAFAGGGRVLCEPLFERHRISHGGQQENRMARSYVRTFPDPMFSLG